MVHQMSFMSFSIVFPGSHDTVAHGTQILMVQNRIHALKSLVKLVESIKI